MIFVIGARKQQSAARLRPVLDLSGPKLRAAFENLIEAAEATGGVERYIGALALKASLFEEVLGNGRVADLTETELLRSRRIRHTGATPRRLMARQQRFRRDASAGRSAACRYGQVGNRR